MRNFTITELEWHNVVDKVQAIEKENEKLKGVIEGMNKAFSLYDVGNRRGLLIGALEEYNKVKYEWTKLTYEDYVNKYHPNL